MVESFEERYEVMVLIMSFLHDHGLDSSRKCLLDEIRQKLPDSVPNAEDLQPRARPNNHLQRLVFTGMDRIKREGGTTGQLDDSNHRDQDNDNSNAADRYRDSHDDKLIDKSNNLQPRDEEDQHLGHDLDIMSDEGEEDIVESQKTPGSRREIERADSSKYLEHQQHLDVKRGQATRLEDSRERFRDPASDSYTEGRIEEDTEAGELQRSESDNPSRGEGGRSGYHESRPKQYEDNGRSSYRYSDDRYCGPGGSALPRGGLHDDHRPRGAPGPPFAGPYHDDWDRRGYAPQAPAGAARTREAVADIHGGSARYAATAKEAGRNGAAAPDMGTSFGGREGGMRGAAMPKELVRDMPVPHSPVPRDANAPMGRENGRGGGAGPRDYAGAGPGARDYMAGPRELRDGGRGHPERNVSPKDIIPGDYTFPGGRDYHHHPRDAARDNHGPRDAMGRADSRDSGWVGGRDAREGHNNPFPEAWAEGNHRTPPFVNGTAAKTLPPPGPHNQGGVRQVRGSDGMYHDRPPPPAPPVPPAERGNGRPVPHNNGWPRDADGHQRARGGYPPPVDGPGVRGGGGGHPQHSGGHGDTRDRPGPSPYGNWQPSVATFVQGPPRDEGHRHVSPPRECRIQDGRIQDSPKVVPDRRASEGKGREMDTATALFPPKVSPAAAPANHVLSQQQQQGPRLDMIPNGQRVLGHSGGDADPLSVPRYDWVRSPGVNGPASYHGQQTAHNTTQHPLEPHRHLDTTPVRGESREGAVIDLRSNLNKKRKAEDEAFGPLGGATTGGVICSAVTPAGVNHSSQGAPLASPRPTNTLGPAANTNSAPSQGVQGASDKQRTIVSLKIVHEPPVARDKAAATNAEPKVNVQDKGPNDANAVAQNKRFRNPGKVAEDDAVQTITITGLGTDSDGHQKGGGWGPGKAGGFNRGGGGGRGARGRGGY